MISERTKRRWLAEGVRKGYRAAKRKAMLTEYSDYSPIRMRGEVTPRIDREVKAFRRSKEGYDRNGKMIRVGDNVACFIQGERATGTVWKISYNPDIVSVELSDGKNIHVNPDKIVKI